MATTTTYVGSLLVTDKPPGICCVLNCNEEATWQWLAPWGRHRMHYRCDTHIVTSAERSPGLFQRRPDRANKLPDVLRRVRRTL